ncbi:MAG: DUF3859 domain-containing protein [Roseicyclus sp.]|nr:DUF3859 domain-containing protein [Roseicyclus sp.]
MTLRAALFLFTLTLPALTLAALTHPVAAQQVDDPRTSPGIADFIYGVYCAQEPEREDPAPNTASGIINIVPLLPDFRFRQKLVPAEIGIGFGVMVTAPAGVVHDPVTVTVTHPPYADSGIEVEQWQTDINATGPSLMGFSFDHAGELLLGEWSFSAHTSDGTELFFITFEVVQPELMPHIIRSCFGSFMS